MTPWHHIAVLPRLVAEVAREGNLSSVGFLCVFYFTFIPNLVLVFFWFVYSFFNFTHDPFFPDLYAGKCVYNVHARTSQKMELSGASLSGYASSLLPLLLLLLLFQNASCRASHGVALCYVTPLLKPDNRPPWCFRLICFQRPNFLKLLLLQLSKR